MRSVILGFLVGWSAWLPAAAQPFAFAEATIDDLQARMAAGTLTARELTAAYLARIEDVDKAGPKLNAIIELNPDALAIADRLDAERKMGRVRSRCMGFLYSSRTTSPRRTKWKRPPARSRSSA